MITKEQIVVWLTDTGWIWIAVGLIVVVIIVGYIKKLERTSKPNIIEQYGIIEQLKGVKKRGRPKKQQETIEESDEDLINTLEGDLEKWVGYRKDLLNRRGEIVNQGNQLRAEIQELDKKLKFLSTVLEQAGLIEKQGKDEKHNIKI